jgi:hypothetical protein
MALRILNFVRENRMAMYCPECKAEYRDGFSHCSDCDVDLVDSLPERGDADDRAFPSEMREVWTGEEQNQCVSICSELRQAEIPFHVLQGRSQFFKGVDLSFKIGVPAEYFDRAKELIEEKLSESQTPFQDDEDMQKAMELPAGGEESDSEYASRESKSKKWNAEEATAEVWSEDELDLSPMIEACLTENGIGSRTDVLENGGGKIPVRLEEGAPAREIVREVVEGVPPK